MYTVWTWIHGVLEILYLVPHKSSRRPFRPMKLFLHHINGHLQRRWSHGGNKRLRVVGSLQQNGVDEFIFLNYSENSGEYVCSHSLEFSEAFFRKWICQSASMFNNLLDLWVFLWCRFSLPVMCHRCRLRSYSCSCFCQPKEYVGIEEGSGAFVFRTQCIHNSHFPSCGQSTPFSKIKGGTFTS